MQVSPHGAAFIDVINVLISGLGKPVCSYVIVGLIEKTYTEQRAQARH